MVLKGGRRSIVGEMGRVEGRWGVGVGVGVGGRRERLEGVVSRVLGEGLL